jgi:hypothetical protein
MSGSTATASSTSVYTTSAFWERLWRTSGIQFVVLFIVAYLIYGYQPQAGASAEALDAFYDGHRTRILIATVISGLNLLNLLWFAAALRNALADAGQDGWGAAATAARRRSEDSYFCTLRFPQPSPTRSPALETTCSHPDSTTSRGPSTC